MLMPCMRPHMGSTRSALVRPATHVHRNHLLLTDHASALLQVSGMWMDLLLVAAMTLEGGGPGSRFTCSWAVRCTREPKPTETTCNSTLPVLFCASVTMWDAQLWHAMEGAERAPAACGAMQGMYQRHCCAQAQPPEQCLDTCTHTVSMSVYYGIGLTSGAQ